MINLIVKNVSKSFGKKTVYKKISYSFSQGCYTFVGKNGIGKSVLLDMLAGTVIQDAGDIILNNGQKNMQDSYKKYLSYTPSNPIFFPGLTGNDYLSFIYKIKNRVINDNLFIEMINGFRIEEYANTKFEDMSLGTRKKFFLLSVIIGCNHLIVLDEPSDALDAESKIVLASVINELSKNSIIIISSHDKDFISKINSTVIELITEKYTKFKV